jgi:acetolactate synthase-1/2/3 large subunit
LTGDDLIAPGSSGFASELFLLNLRLKAGQRCFHNRGTGSMGFGLPGAIGACLASGKRRTICVEGDGGFQMNAQELATLARERLPVKCFVVNNRGYASIRASQSANFGRLTGADESSGLRLPDLSRLAAAYGVPYARIERHADLEDRLRDILNGEAPVLCELVAQADEARIPRVMTRLDAQGLPETSPLEDLYPFLDREELRANMEAE